MTHYGERDRSFRMVLRSCVWLATVGLAAVIGMVILEVVIPPLTVDAAMMQMEDTAQAYRQIRLHEQAKNYVAIAEVFFLCVITVACFAAPAGHELRRLFSKGEKA